MNIAKLIMGIALCAISGCAQFSGKTENASSISAEAIRCIKIAVDEEVCKSNFNEALALNVLDYINGIVENKKLNDELSKKEKDEILRLVTEEYNRLKSQVIYPAWAKYVWSNVERKAAGFINSSDYKKAIETIENRVSSGNSEVDALVASLANKYLDEVLCPSWLRFEIKKVDDAVAKLIAEKKFLEAREVLWNAPLTGVAKVDEPLRVHCVKVMRKNVNPVHWPILESEIKGIYKKYSEKESEYEICIEKLKAYNLQRPYSIKIERKLALVVSEALKLGVNKDSVHPVFSAAKNLLKEAANLVDNRDVSTTNTSTRISKAAFSPELEKYNLALQEFRVHLIKYDCTEKSADVVVSTVDSMMRPLLSSLAKDAEYEKISSMEFELGITALNNRIAALRDQLVSDVKTKIEKRELRKLQGKVSSLTEKVVALAKAGRFAEAREMAWKAAADDPRVRQVAVDVITNIINPMHWKEAEKEISDKIAKFINDGSYNQAVAWLAKYPRIRTYSSEIDVKLSAVGDEALKLGLDSEKVQSVIVETKDLASIVERLVNNTDREVPLDEKKQLVSDGLTAALDEYVKALKRHDCTDENALKLADFVKKRLSLVFEDSLSKTSSTKMELGSNAFNKRLDALIVAQRNKVLDSEYNFVSDALVEKVFDAVNKRQFDKARQIVRDEPMKGDPDWDAKFYILKVGLINSVVNPAEVRFRMDEIKKMESVAEKDGGFAKLLKWINDYVYIKENYPSIEQSVAAIKNAGKGYKLEEKEMLEYSKKMLDRIYFVLGRRVGAYKPIVDDKELNKALSEFSKLMLAQYYDKAKVGMITERIKDEISEIYTEKFVAMTVCDSNAKLLARLMQARDKALEDSEFCDFEVSRAEAAIAEQVGGTEKYGHKYQCNAVLGDYARAMRLRKKGRILNAELYQSLLLGAIYLDSCDVFDYALAKGAVLDASSRRDPLKRPAILLALQLGRNSFVEKIRQKGASLSVCDVNGNGVIHYAVERGDLTMLRMMMKGNDINLKNKAGETPLFIAVRKNQPALVKLLTGVDAKSERPRSSVGIKNAAEKNVFDVACEYGSRDVLDILEKAGAEYGPAQLIIAVSNSRLAVVKWLVAMGVDVNAPGVMAAVVNTEVENYLVSEGGIPVSKPAFVPSVKASGTNREASVIGNIEFKLKEVK